MDRILFMAGDFAAPFFARWLEPDQASRAAEWAVRIVLAYLADPAPAPTWPIPTTPGALVRAFVLPGILALRSTVRRRPVHLPSATSPSTEPSHHPHHHQRGQCNDHRR